MVSALPNLTKGERAKSFNPINKKRKKDNGDQTIYSKFIMHQTMPKHPKKEKEKKNTDLMNFNMNLVYACKWAEKINYDSHNIALLIIAK